MAKEHPVEVWDGNRLITTIEPHAITRRLTNVGQWGGVYAEHVVGFCAGERAISGFAAEAETAPF